MGGQPALIGNSHGWQPPTEDPEVIMELLEEAVDNCGYRDKVAYALDMAATEMYDKETNTYYLNGSQVTPEEQIEYVRKLTERFPFLFVEDVLQENDWKGFAEASKKLTRTILIGDDLTITNPGLLKKAYEENAVQGFIFKPNQVGTITEAIEARNYAKEHDLVGINNASEYNHAIRDLKLADEIKNRYHICHISTKETVLALAKARETNKLVSGEACPHHLILTDENIKDLNPNYKMNPPLRSKADLEALIKGINDDVVTVIATDHAPHAIEEKNKPIDKAPFGIIGNQHAFSLMYTYIVKKGLISLEKVLTCMSLNPAKIIGIDHDLEVGKMANFVVFDLDEEYTITKDNIKSKSINTPFLDTKCYGVLKYHVLDGVVSEI